MPTDEEKIKVLQRVALEIDSAINQIVRRRVPMLADGIVILLAYPDTGDTVTLCGSLRGAAKIDRALTTGRDLVKNRESDEVHASIVRNGQVKTVMFVDGVAHPLKEGTH